MDVQMVIRGRADLEASIETTLPGQGDNPALDYLGAYQAWRTNRVEGVFAQPIALEAPYPAGLMMYIETADRPRFGPTEAAHLSLAVVLYLGQDRYGILLADGPASAGRLLFGQWINVLGSLEINGEAPAFLTELPALLAGLAAPEQMAGTYTLLVGPLQSLEETAQESEQARSPLPYDPNYLLLDDYEIGFSSFPPWRVDFPDAATAIMSHPEGQARLRFQILPLPSDYDISDPLGYLDGLAAEADYQALGEGVRFSWDPQVSALNTYTGGGEFEYAAYVLSESLDLRYLLVLSFEGTSAALGEPLNDWIDILSVLQLEGYPLNYDGFFQALTEVTPFPAPSITPTPED
jgi:hypothetical protein